MGSRRVSPSPNRARGLRRSGFGLRLSGLRFLVSGLGLRLAGLGLRLGGRGRRRTRTGLGPAGARLGLTLRVRRLPSRGCAAGNGAATHAPGGLQPRGSFRRAGFRVPRRPEPDVEAAPAGVAIPLPEFQLLRLVLVPWKMYRGAFSGPCAPDRILGGGLHRLERRLFRVGRSEVGERGEEDGVVWPRCPW